MSDRLTRFVAGALVAIGGLMVLLCGSCTLVFGGGGLVALIRGEDAGLSTFILITALMVGGLPTAAGVVLLVNGWKSWQANRPPSG
ncbi:MULTISPECIES: hypothetical protein [unclassified Phenylobacterium]|uniref:hypothetical protein n=1 Tax=unclassified Phenylobacterium TaxID=2640670 RepID=UPI00083AB894|nr:MULTISPECIES: hypothetical protein [unclassified Phenylobacterium]